MWSWIFIPGKTQSMVLRHLLKVQAARWSFPGLNSNYFLMKYPLSQLNRLASKTNYWKMLSQEYVHVFPLLALFYQVIKSKPYFSSPKFSLHLLRLLRKCFNKHYYVFFFNLLYYHSKSEWYGFPEIWRVADLRP